MYILSKENKVFYKVEETTDEEGKVTKTLIGGKKIALPNKELASEFKEFDSEEQAREYFGIPKPEIEE